MIKKLSAVAAVVLALSSGGPTLAADLPSIKGPPPLPPPPIFTWTGFYVGVNLGGGWRERHDNNNWWGFTSPVKMSRFDQAASPVTATISTAVLASEAARITKAIVSAV